MADARTISTKQVTAAAKSTVAKVVAQHKALRRPDIILGFVRPPWWWGAVAELVGNEGGVVSGVFNLESSDVSASDWRPRHDEHYHEA